MENGGWDHNHFAGSSSGTSIVIRNLPIISCLLPLPAWRFE